MSLRSKIILILAAVVTLYAVLDQVIQRAIIEPEFIGFEEAEARKDLERVMQALDREVDELGARCRDWARWDETYRFVAEYDRAGDEADDFVRSNLEPASLADANIHLLYICDPNGRVVWGSIVDPETGAPLQLREFPSEALAPERGLMHHNDLLDDQSGIMLTEGRPLLVSSRPIVTSRAEGPKRGVVIIGRFLSTATVASLEQRTGVAFEHWPLFSPDLPETERLVRDDVTGSATPVVRREHDGEGKDVLHVYSTVDDFNEAPALLIRANVKPAISERGETSMRYAFLSTIAAGLLMLLVLLSLLQRIVLAPIAALTKHALAVARTDDTFTRLGSKREDEIGILSREFDDMLEKLSVSRAALVDSARSAGMSEIATGVLHNVGNVLNSVNVSASIVAQKVRSSTLDDLNRLMAVLDEHERDLAAFVKEDPKGKHLHPFLKSLTAKLNSDRDVLKKETASLTDGIDHVKMLIKSQQTYAKNTKVLESTVIAEQVEAALGMSYQVQPQHGELEVVRDFEPLPRINVDRHKLMEILVNLILNARQAMDEANSSRKVLTVRIARAEENELLLSVGDTGVGIAPEHLTSIFNHGFTTKKQGHGFGLHTAANAATEMGGSLEVESDGVGHGATFVLRIPCKLAPEAIAA